MRGLLRARTALGLALLCGCRAEAPTATVTRDPTTEARVLLEGPGPQVSCKSDADCSAGPTVPGHPQVRAACVLGACFGALSADDRAVRSLMLERLRRTDADVRQAAWPAVRQALESPSPGLQLAAVETAGAMLMTDRSQAQVRLALQRASASLDAHVATAARVGLGLAGDPDVVPALLADLSTGTELTRTEAVKALTPALKAGHAEVRQTLIALLDDASPVVQLAAVRSLALAREQVGVRPALQRLAGQSPSLGYAIDRALGR